MAEDRGGREGDGSSGQLGHLPPGTGPFAHPDRIGALGEVGDVSAAAKQKEAFADARGPAQQMHCRRLAGAGPVRELRVQAPDRARGGRAGRAAEDLERRTMLDKRAVGKRLRQRGAGAPGVAAGIVDLDLGQPLFDVVFPRRSARDDQGIAEQGGRAPGLGAGQRSVRRPGKFHNRGQKESKDHGAHSQRLTGRRFTRILRPTVVKTASR